LQAKDLDSFAALWSRDAIWRAPITPEGGPGKVVGRDAIVSMLRDAFAIFGDVHFEWRLEAMRDSRDALATWSLDNELVDGGRYVNRGLAVIRLRRGLIREFEEHFDTIAWQATFGTR
jgi:ketosteroid isomerase-like protein